MAETIDCVKRALAAELRARNSTRARGAKHPDEVWVSIWLHLSMVDIVTASHVCHAWRCLALRTPRLWCSLDFYSSCHYDRCKCDLCASIKYCDGLCSHGCVLKSGRTNERLVVELLARSHQLPLRLSLDVDGYGDSFKYFCGALTPHVSRVITLTSAGDKIYALAGFLTYFSQLPELRSLTSQDSSPCHYSRLFRRHIMLPKLQQLEYHGSIGDYDKVYKDADIMPSVQSLTTTWISSVQLCALLNACSNLKRLRVRMIPERADEDIGSWKDSCLLVQDSAHDIDDILVSNLTSSLDEVADTAFGHPERRRLTFEYSRSLPASFDAFSFSGFAIFGHLKGGATDLECTFEANATGRIHVTTHEGQRLQRTVITSAVVLPMLWVHLVIFSLETLHLDARMWPAMTTAAPGCLQHLRVLRLGLPHAFGFRNLLDTLPAALCVPNLRELDIYSVDGDVAFAHIGDVQAFTRSLRVKRPFRLTVQHSVCVEIDSPLEDT